MNTLPDNVQAQPKGLELNNYSIGFLKEIAKWSKFIAIVGFIGIGLIVFFAFTVGSLFSTMPTMVDNPIQGLSSGFIIVYLLVALLYFFPVYYLYKFSQNLKSSISSNNNDELTKSFEYLKSHYKFIGIFIIVIMSIYVLTFLLSIFTLLI